ncbi:MAG TPA: CCA tRNA nucleotidyltransferase [Gemmatimonas sp.]|nr:CCA tRNA nucleotidyltransferase [Gemmatimonas sp.]
MTPSLERLRPPPEVVAIARTLIGAGYETWCVGGAVRDALLGESNLDWDIATAAKPPEVKRLFRRTVPVGIEFGTIGVLDAKGVMHEVTTFRRDVEHDGRHAIVEFGASLDDDLARRDFTVNAIAYHPLEKRLHDPFDGQGDLRERVIRAVGDAQLRLEEDRLRALRAIRFASRFDFRIEPSTWNAVTGSAPFLSRLSPERVKQEIEKTMEQVTRPSIAFRRWREAGAFASLAPALSTVSDGALAAIDCLPRPGLRGRPQRRALRIAALFGECDEHVTQRALRALRFSNQDIAWISAITDRWARLGARLTETMLGPGAASPLTPTDAELRRLASAVGRTRTPAFMRIAAANWATLPEHARPAPSAVRTLHRRLVHVAYHDAIETGDLALDGDDMRMIGIGPGPVVGRILGVLLADVIEDPARNERGLLLERAAALHASFIAPP